MADVQFLTLTVIEQKACDIAAEQLLLRRDKISPASRLIEDLHCDSLGFIELLMEFEDCFDVTLSETSPDPIFQAVFTRKEIRLSDIAECIYFRQGTGKPKRSVWGNRPAPEAPDAVPFCQLDGLWNSERELPLFERIGNQKSFPQYRRRSDGMRSVLIPPAKVEIGTDDPSFISDCHPQHSLKLDHFLIDAEPVSTTAFCRFLNTIGDVDHDTLLDWFVLTDSDHRSEHMLIEKSDAGWMPLSGCEKYPMILVSWYGANAYSLWANQRDWSNYRSGETSFLPTEAQWEYAARGPDFKLFPWGDEPPTDDAMRYGQHKLSEDCTAAILPIAAVNQSMGMSPFGLHHMAGNIWQWCRDWYDAQYYSRPEASEDDACCQTETGIRCERGGSWVGPAELCRSSHRRGRVPNARGRCLGFRCVSDVHDIADAPRVMKFDGAIN